MYASVKIGGFALSIAACLLIALYIRHELSYDRYYPDAEQLYRVVAEVRDNGVEQRGLSFPAPFAAVIKDELPEVENVARVMPNRLFTGAGSNQFRPADKTENTYEEGFAYADPQLPGMFHLPLVYGDAAQALAGPNTIVISKNKADKYFPNENPVGKLVVLNDDTKKLYRIGGVMEDFPSNSHFRFDFLLSLSGVEFWPGEQTNWMSSNYENYVRLRKGTDAERLSQKMQQLVLEKYYIPVMRQAGNKDIERLGKTLLVKFSLQPVKDIHLRSNGINNGAAYGDIRFIWLFGAVACFILIIACINFVNLATARSANRAKEVGLKKAIGSGRGQLVWQFLTESVVLSFLSFGIGILLAWVLLPYFNTLAGKTLVFPWTAWWLAPVITAASVVLGLLAGLYPAFYLSSFQPMAVLKGRLGGGTRNTGLRSALVVFQFTASVVLIISTIVIYRQMDFILNRAPGFDKEQVLMIQGAQTLGDRVTAFKQRLQQLPQVKSVSVSDYLPVEGTRRNGNSFWKEGKTREENAVDGQFWRIDHDYIKTMGMHIVAGRDFSPVMPTDSQAAVINEALAKRLFPGEKDPTGKRITNGGDVYQVIGVVGDFNFESMRTNIEGLCMVLGSSSSIVSVKVNTGDMQGLLRTIGGEWKNIAPQQPFRYAFLDERFAVMYADVQRMGYIFTSCSALAIIIACLGLFALSAYMAEQRGKEISIRKVLGASAVQVTSLISKDFLKLVMIAIVLASPIAWWGMKRWLQDFVYQAAISWWIFAAASALVIVIALATIGFQSVKAAIANPVGRLKSE